MSNITVFTGQGGLARPGKTKAGSGASTEGLTFGKPAEQYSDLPTGFRRGGGSSTALVLRREQAARQPGTSIELARPENIVAPKMLPPKLAETTIASGVRLLEKSYKRGESIVQRKLGWVATPTYIYVTTVERELQWSGEKKLKPAGEWLIENRRKWTAAQGAAEKRVGVVREEAHSGADASSNARFVEEAEEIPDAFVKGAEAMAYLPLAVRGDIVSQVPHPNYFDGRLLGVVDPETGEVGSTEVSLLRMDDTTALVISAVKELKGSEWRVTQAKYELTTPEVEAAS